MLYIVPNYYIRSGVVCLLTRMTTSIKAKYEVVGQTNINKQNINAFVKSKFFTKQFIIIIYKNLLSKS